MDTSNTVINTKNLCLKGITLGYDKNIFKEFDKEITTLMTPKPAEKIEETIAFIKTSIKENKEGSNLQLVVLDKINKDFIGCCGLNRINTKTPELGVWLKKAAHGHGYGKEAMIALKEWADDNIDYEYILYRVAESNIPSKKIIEFLGAKMEKESDEVNMSGNEMHVLEYRIYPPKK